MQVPGQAVDFQPNDDLCALGSRPTQQWLGLSVATNTLSMWNRRFIDYFSNALLQVPDSIGLTVACLGHPVRPYFMVDTLNLYFAHENAQHFRMMHLPLLWKRHNEFADPRERRPVVGTFCATPWSVLRDFELGLVCHFSGCCTLMPSVGTLSICKFLQPDVVSSVQVAQPMYTCATKHFVTVSTTSPTQIFPGNLLSHF